MIDWKNVGEYLGRELLLGSLVDSPPAPDDLQLTKATVLVLLNAYNGSDFDKEWLRSILSSYPLAVAVGGAGARKAFDDLINLVSTPDPGEHIMTGVFDTADVKEAVSGFLYATWPAEERFDDWKRIAFLVIGDQNELYEQTSLAIKEIADRRQAPGVIAQGCDHA